MTDPDPIRSIARLDDPVRRSLYDWLIAQPDAVGRDEAAAAVGISRALAAFHLDKLLEDGLLTTEYRRLSGRTGPGAGRPAKLYRRAPGTIEVSLPARDYRFAATVLAEAAERATDELPPPSVRAAARDAGHALGTVARAAAGPRPTPARRRAALVEVLRERGYEPRVAPDPEDGIVLGNCPFDALVDDHRDLVCGMNLALADGALDTLGDTGLQAVLDKQPGQCCVCFRPDR